MTPLNVVVVFSPFFPANLKHRTCPIVEIELAFDAPCLIKVGHRTGLVSSWFEMSKVSVSPAMSAYSRRLCVPVSLKVHSSVPSSALPQGSDPFGQLGWHGAQLEVTCAFRHQQDFLLNSTFEQRGVGGLFAEGGDRFEAR